MKQKALLIYGTLIIPIMIIAFYLLTSFLGKTLGYVTGYLTYLILLIVGILVFKKEKINIKKNKNVKYYVFVFLPVIFTGLIIFIPNAINENYQILGIVVVYAILNGSLEELFWRYTFFIVYDKNICNAYIIPTILFAGWHISLMFAKGIFIYSGVLVLVGGALAMGIIFGFVLKKTGNIKIVIISHIMVNIIIFTQLISQNWF